jgi:hypothetical protein
MAPLTPQQKAERTYNAAAAVGAPADFWRIETNVIYGLAEKPYI